jgi:hypothetical protein
MAKETETHEEKSGGVPGWGLTLGTIAAAGAGLFAAAAFGATPIAITGTLAYFAYRAMTERQRRESRTASQS